MATTQALETADTTTITRCGKCGTEYTAEEILARCPKGAKNTFGEHYSFSCSCGSSVDAARVDGRFLNDRQLRALVRGRLNTQAQVHLGLAGSGAAAGKSAFTAAQQILSQSASGYDPVAAMEAARAATKEYEAKAAGKPAASTPASIISTAKDEIEARCKRAIARASFTPELKTAAARLAGGGATFDREAARIFANELSAALSAIGDLTVLSAEEFAANLDTITSEIAGVRSSLRGVAK